MGGTACETLVPFQRTQARGQGSATPNPSVAPWPLPGSLSHMPWCLLQFPQELVTYGGNGQVFNNWAQVGEPCGLSLSFLVQKGPLEIPGLNL